MKLLKFGSFVLSASVIVSCSNGTSNNSETNATTENVQEEIITEATDSVSENPSSKSEDDKFKTKMEEKKQRMISDQHQVEGTPNIKSFVYALLPSVDEYYKDPKNLKEMDEQCDMKNGYFELYEEGDGMYKLACCYWNRKDGKKLVAFHCDVHESDVNPDTLLYHYNSFLLFFLYNEETQKLEYIEAPFNKPLGEGHLECMLPQEGKDIEYSFWEDGQEERDLHILKWNGMGFDVQ